MPHDLPQSDYRMCEPQDKFAFLTRSGRFRSVVGEPSAFASRQHRDRLCRRRS